jgi:hypothetical protein
MGASHRWREAAHRAAAVAFGEGETLCPGEEPAFASVEGLAITAQHTGDDTAAGGEPARAADADRKV